MTDYYPYGTPMQSSTGAEVNCYKYGGKEFETEGGLNHYDFEARTLIPQTAMFTIPDPKAGNYPGLNPYLYCAANPMKYIDPTGKWTVQVSASSNRSANPYALYTVYDKNNILIFQTVVKVKGEGDNAPRNRPNTDTPQGDYKILEWRKTGNGRYKIDAFGKNDILALEYKENQEGGARGGIHTHGGRSQSPELTMTHGCIRMADEDIKQLKIVTDQLTEEDPSDKPQILTVTDNLVVPVTYQQRSFYLIIGAIKLPEVIVPYNVTLDRNKDNDTK